MSLKHKPIAPWSIHKLNLSMTLSFLHRITGVFLTFILWCGVLVWCDIISNPVATFGIKFNYKTLWWCGVIFCSWALGYHTANGIKHFFWDRGYGMDVSTLAWSGLATFVTSILLAWCIMYYGIGI